MTDAIQCLKPGWRAFDSSGDLLSGAILTFFDAGTSTPRTVYSNRTLLTSLGTSVTCDSAGYPTSNGNAKVEIYTGNTAYKIVLKDADANTIFSHDNVIGALDTSSFITSSSLTPSFPITNTSSNQAPTLADKAKFYNVNCSGGDVTFTIDSAATCANGWSIKVRHDGTANQVLFVGTGGELFKIPSIHAGVTAFASTQRGQVYCITCDGTGFKVEQTGGVLFNSSVGVIQIVTRTSTPPASPEAGARYIVGSGPSGAWSTFAQYDIAEATGQSTWVKYTPFTDCGWLAYVQDENRNYQFQDSAWVIAGVATQAEMEAHTAVSLVTAANAQYHPGVLKAYANFNGVTTVAIRQSYNVSSITDTGDGDYGVNLTTAFADANHAPTAGGSSSGTNASALQFACYASSASVIKFWGGGNTATLQEWTHCYVHAAGDQ